MKQFRGRGMGVLGVIAATVVVALGVTSLAAGATGVAAKAPSAALLKQGKAVFTKTCGSCHTLANAKTKGKVGPNLDQLKPKLALVTKQVTNGGGGMPSLKLLGKAKIKAVATYVSYYAGKKK